MWVVFFIVSRIVISWLAGLLVFSVCLKIINGQKVSSSELAILGL